MLKEQVLHCERSAADVEMKHCQCLRGSTSSTNPEPDNADKASYPNEKTDLDRY